MADAKPKPPNLVHDFLWFIGILIAFFFLWVWGGGPERARKNPPSPVIQNGPAQVSPTPNSGSTPSGSNSAVNPSRPTPPSSSATPPGSATNNTGGQIQVTPL